LSGVRLVIGVIIMGIILPVVLFFLLGLSTLSQLLTAAAASLLAWGAGDLLAGIMERPRLRGRSAREAIRDDLERRHAE
jgi:hypothetical protein